MENSSNPDLVANYALGSISRDIKMQAHIFHVMLHLYLADNLFEEALDLKVFSPMYEFISRDSYHVFEAAMNIGELRHVALHFKEELSLLFFNHLLIDGIFLLYLFEKRESAKRLLIFILFFKNMID